MFAVLGRGDSGSHSRGHCNPHTSKGGGREPRERAGKLALPMTA